MNVSILGAGNWGTTFGLLAYRAGHRVTLWEYDEQQARRVAETRINEKYLPGQVLPDDLQVTPDLRDAAVADVLVLAVPAQTCRPVLKRLGSVGDDTVLLSLVKGIEQLTLSSVSEMCAQELPNFRTGRYAVLSGPTIAPEVAAGLPTSAVVASTDEATAAGMQCAFSTSSFRVYTSDDVVGVELAGALKNVIALAAGMCDGMKLGHNTKGALLTRGLAELVRVGEALGGKRQTFAGLSGIGDLVTTCTSPVSRNRTVGERIGQGERLENVLSGMVMVAEGVTTARAVRDLARRHGVSVPITDAVCNVLFDGKSPKVALSELMQRTLKAED